MTDMKEIPYWDRSCKRCYSRAVNPRLHGREPEVDLDLCDVCYWRKRAEALTPGEET